MSTLSLKVRAWGMQMVLVLAICLPLAVNVQPIAAAPLSIRVGQCAQVYNANSAGGLKVRTGPSLSAGIVKYLSDGTQVTILEGPRSANGYTWWRHNQGGWSADAYLKDCPVVPAGPDVAGARNILYRTSAMKSPWTQVDAPLKNTAGQRSAIWYGGVIDQFDVANATFAGRYVGSGGRCNIFAGDVMRAMNAPLPTKGQLGTGASGSKWTDPMTANATDVNRWLSQSQGGWRSINPTTASGLSQLIAWVNAGKPALASTPGHIAVIRPGQGNLSSWKNLTIAQAGAALFLSGPIWDRFAGQTPQFFIHD